MSLSPEIRRLAIEFIKDCVAKQPLPRDLQVQAGVSRIYRELDASFAHGEPPPTEARCDCGAALTACASCVVSDYQAAHPDCPQCCVAPAAPHARGEHHEPGCGVFLSRIAYDEVSPAKWQLVMGCRTKGDKNVSKRRAQELFPKVKCTHAISDALLLAEFCRRLTAQGRRDA